MAQQPQKKSIDVRIGQQAKQDLRDLGQVINQTQVQLGGLVRALNTIKEQAGNANIFREYARALKELSAIQGLANLSVIKDRINRTSTDSYASAALNRNEVSIDRIQLLNTEHQKTIGLLENQYKAYQRILSAQDKQAILDEANARRKITYLERANQITDLGQRLEWLNSQQKAAQLRVAMDLESNNKRRLQTSQAYLDSVNQQLETTKQLASEQKKLRAEDERYQSRLRNAGRDLEFSRAFSMARVTDDGGASIMAIQARLLANYKVLGGLTGGIGFAANFTKELDTTSSQLQAITEATNNDMKALNDSLLQVAQSSKYMATEVYSAAVTLGQAGFNAQQISDTMKSVSMLAAASGTDLGKSVDVLTSVLSIYNLTASESTTVANQLTQAMNSSKLDIEKLALGFQYAGNTAAQSGVRFTELTAALAALSNSGIKSGSTIGTGFRQLLTDIEQPTDKFKEVLKRLGLTISDVDVKAKGIYTVLETLKNAGFTASDALASFEVRAASTYSALANNMDVFSQTEEALNGTTAATKANEIQMGSLSAQTTRLQSNLGVLASQAFQPVLLMLRDMAKLTADLVQGLTQFSGTLQLAGTALAAFGAYKGLRFLGDMIAGFISLRKELTLFAAAASTAGSVTSAGGLLGLAARFAGPIAATATAVGGLTMLLSAYLDKQSKLNDAVDKSQTTVNTYKGAVQEKEQALAMVDQRISSLLDRYASLKKAEDDNKSTNNALAKEVRETEAQFMKYGLTIEGTARNSVEGLIQSLKDLKVQLSQDYQLDLSNLNAQLEQLNRATLEAQLQREKDSQKPGFSDGAFADKLGLGWTDVSRRQWYLNNGLPVKLFDQEAMSKLASSPLLAGEGSNIARALGLASGTPGYNGFGTEDIMKGRASISTLQSKLLDRRLAIESNPKKTWRAEKDLEEIADLMKWLDAASEVISSKAESIATVSRNKKEIISNRARIEASKIANSGKDQNISQALKLRAEANLLLEKVHQAETPSERDSILQNGIGNLRGMGAIEGEIGTIQKSIKAAIAAKPEIYSLVYGEASGANDRLAQIMSDLKTERAEVDKILLGYKNLRITQEQRNLEKQLKVVRARMENSQDTDATGSLRNGTTPYDRFIATSSVKYGVDADLIRAVIKQESGFKPNITSKRGAAGLMQLMPGTGAMFGLDSKTIYDPEKNIDAGTRYLAQLLNQYKGDKATALAAWNWGPGNLAKYGKTGSRPAETRGFINNVMSFYKEFESKSSGGEIESAYRKEQALIGRLFDSRLRQLRLKHKDKMNDIEYKQAEQELLGQRDASLEEAKEKYEALRNKAVKRKYAELREVFSGEMKRDFSSFINQIDSEVKTADSTKKSSSIAGGAQVTQLEAQLRYMQDPSRSSSFTSYQIEALQEKLRDAKMAFKRGEVSRYGAMINSKEGTLGNVNLRYRANTQRLDELNNLAQSETNPEEQKNLQVQINQLEKEQTELQSKKVEIENQIIEAKEKQKDLILDTTDVEVNQIGYLKSMDLALSKYAKSINLVQAAADGMKESFDAAASSLGQAFSNLIDGSEKSAAGAARSFALTWLKAIQSILVKMMAMYVMQQLLGLAGYQVNSAGTAIEKIPTPAGAFTGGMVSAAGTIQAGGVARRFANGGLVTGGTIGRDSVHALLAPGEIVMNTTAVSAVGADYLMNLNQMGNREVTQSGVVPLKDETRTPQDQGGGTVNVWVVTPDQQAAMGPSDVIVTVADNITRNGSIKKLIKQVQLGQV